MPDVTIRELRNRGGDVVERVIPHPQPEDLKAIREEAIAAVVRLGAQPDTVDVAIDVNTTTGRVRATAIGSAELNVRDEAGAISEVEARAIGNTSISAEAKNGETARIDLTVEDWENKKKRRKRRR